MRLREVQNWERTGSKTGTRVCTCVGPSCACAAESDPTMAWGGVVAFDLLHELGGRGGIQLTLTCPRAAWAFIKRIQTGKRKGPPDFSKWAFHPGGALFPSLSREIWFVPIRRIANGPSRGDQVPPWILLDCPRFVRDADRTSQLFSFILSPLTRRLLP